MLLLQVFKGKLLDYNRNIIRKSQSWVINSLLIIIQLLVDTMGVTELHNQSQ